MTLGTAKNKVSNHNNINKDIESRKKHRKIKNKNKFNSFIYISCFLFNFYWS